MVVLMMVIGKRLQIQKYAVGSICTLMFLVVFLLGFLTTIHDPTDNVVYYQKYYQQIND